MRNTECGWKTAASRSFRSLALVRSCPNGFSMTTRRQPGSSGPSVRPDRSSWRTTTGNCAWRDRQVERAVAAGAALGVERRRPPRRAGRRPRRRRSRRRRTACRRRPAARPPRGTSSWRARGPHRRAAGEVLVRPVPAGEADEREAGRQQPAVGQVVDGRQQLLARQVAGHAEHHQDARLGDPGDPAITRIAQRVGHQLAICWAAPLCPCELRVDGAEQPVPGVGELLHALVLEHGDDVVVADPELLEVGEDLPWPRRRSRRWCCRAPRRGRPWRACVASGIVFTVCGATRSSTYMVSR